MPGNYCSNINYASSELKNIFAGNIHVLIMDHLNFGNNHAHLTIELIN